MEAIQDNYFWEIDDKARDIAGQHSDWEQLETLSEFACDQAGIDDELRESIENSLDQKRVGPSDYSKGKTKENFVGRIW